VGVNFATAFLREDGRMLADVPLSRVLRHIDHLVERLGEDGVALGSDYDGAVVPTELDGIDRLPRLREAMREHGYGEALIKKLCFRNWLGVLRRTWEF
jgi:membrane dipeptidase